METPHAGSCWRMRATETMLMRRKPSALVGVEDLVIVDTPDALLIANRAKAQDVSKLVKTLEEQKRDELL